MAVAHLAFLEISNNLRLVCEMMNDGEGEGWCASCLSCV